MQIVEQLERDIRSMSEIKEFLLTSPFVKKYYDGGNIEGSSDSIRIKPKTYEELVEMLRDMRLELGREVSFKQSFFACGVMIFTWDSGPIAIWFQCLPENVPTQLLPSSSCKVVRVVKEEEEIAYKIVCGEDNEHI